MAVVATGHNGDLLEQAINPALEAVAEWIASKSLSLSASKSVAVILTTKRGYRPPCIYLEGSQLNLSEQVRYLGVELSCQPGFAKHVESAAAKTNETVVALARLMPNVGGSKQGKRGLLMRAAESRLLYGALVWALALKVERNMRTHTAPSACRP